MVFKMNKLQEAADWIFINTSAFADLGPKDRIELIIHILKKDQHYVDNYKTIGTATLEGIRAEFRL